MAFDFLGLLRCTFIMERQSGSRPTEHGVLRTAHRMVGGKMLHDRPLPVMVCTWPSGKGMRSESRVWLFQMFL